MITASLKKNLNSAYRSMINRIVLNGDLELEEYYAEIVDAILLIEFEIPESIVTLNKVEFFAGDTLLSECKVYVPITGNILFKYRTEVI
jgi:hypothetical protein